jgi:hypothetical protein
MVFLAIVMEIADPSTFGLPGSSLWNCIEATVNENMRRVVFQRDPHYAIRPPIIGGEPMIRWIFLQVRLLPFACSCLHCVRVCSATLSSEESSGDDHAPALSMHSICKVFMACLWASCEHSLILQVASALDYLHRHPLRICNRDVKPENVLVVTFEPHADRVQRPVCKIADFGFSKALSGRESATRLGTAFYVAPEIYLLRTYGCLSHHMHSFCL